MAFINSILTDEEKEMFKERAIPYPIDIWWRKGDVLGYELYCKSNATLDRESKIYLFDCGRDHNDDYMDDFHFALVWDEVLGNTQVYFHLKLKRLKESIQDKGRDIFWELYKEKLPYNKSLNISLLHEKLKEALTVYGLDGDPDFKGSFVVKFDF